MNKFSTPFMAKSPLPKKTLEEKIKETKKAAFIRSKSDYADYEESPEERKAQKKLARLEKRLDRKQKRKEKKEQK